jgi:predicted CoA-binding protein
MITKKSLEEFRKSKKLAIVGVSRDTKKFGYTVYNELKNRGYSVIPVNPFVDSINGEICYKDMASLPDDVDGVIIVTPELETYKIAEQTVGKGIKNIWIQQMSETKEVINYLSDKDVNLIYKECILMYSEPVGSLHKFHRFVNRVFGKYPK